MHESSPEPKCTNIPGVEKGDARNSLMNITFHSDDFFMCLGAPGVTSLLLFYC